MRSGALGPHSTSQHGPGCELLGAHGVPEQDLATLGAVSNVFGVAVAVLLVEVEHEAERLDATHLRPEGESAVWARAPHA